MSLEDRLYPLLSLYQRLPQGLRHGIGTAWRFLPRSLRLGRAYSEFRALIETSANWSPDQLKDYQLKQLRRTLNNAATHCPHYERTFARAGFRPESLQTFDDLLACPTLEKKDLLNDLDGLTARNLPPSQRLYITTGGSTGIPVGFHLQKGVSRPKEQAFLEAMWRRAGYTDQSRLAVIRGHVTSDKASGKIDSHDATRDWLMLSSYHLTEERLPEYLAAIERFQPDLLHAYPSAALQLAEYLDRAQQSLRVPLRGLLCGSERLTLPQKRLLERVFNCRVYRWYGHSERVILAGEGPTSELFHFFPQYGFVEFGPPDADGLREIIGTSFHNLVMPLIRYHTGDLAQLAPPDASRDFPWTSVVDVVGRDQEFLVSATGRRISLTAFNMHDDVFDGLYAVQFHQEEKGKTEFQIVPGPNFHRSRLPAIEQALQRKLGDDFTITIREVHDTERTARGKHRWLVSKLS